MNMKKKIWNRDGYLTGDTMDKRFRSPNITPREKVVLFSLIKERIKIVECKKTDVASQNMKSFEWQKIAEEFNARSEQFFRTPATLRAAWDNWKKSVRRSLTLDKTGEGGRKDPFLDAVGSLILCPKDQKSSGNQEAIVQGGLNQELQNEMIEIVKTDVLSPAEAYGNTDDSYLSESHCIDSNHSEHSFEEHPQERRETFCNFAGSYPNVSNERNLCSSSSESTQSTLCNGESREHLSSPASHEETSSVPDTSTHRSMCLILDSDLLYSNQPAQRQSDRTSEKLTSPVPPHSQEESANNESVELFKTKIDALKMMTKHSLEEHQMLQNFFEIKMLQEKEKLELEKRKNEIETERLRQEKIKSQILLLQLEQLKKQ